MDEGKRKRLAAAGWAIGDTEQFLSLTAQELAMVRIHEALASGVKSARQAAGITQMELAERLGSSQSRVAKIEAADPGVSVDLLIRASLAAGRTVDEVGRLVSEAGSQRKRPVRTRRARATTRAGDPEQA